MSIELLQIEFAYFSTMHQLWIRALFCSILTIFISAPILFTAFWIALMLSSLHLVLEEKKKPVVFFDTLFKFILFGSMTLNPLFYIWYLSCSLSNYVDYGILRHNSQCLYVSRTLQQDHEIFNFVYTLKERSILSLTLYFINGIVEGYIIQHQLLHTSTYFKFLPLIYCFLQIKCMNVHYGHLQDEVRTLLPRRDSKMRS
eukprot:NODE_926_length_3039_cov_1.403401.p2 type:complete len:200 gc:universal NODE_926_length_3039_cov_1.403401:633-34(-)